MIAVQVAVFSQVRAGGNKKGGAENRH